MLGSLSFFAELSAWQWRIIAANIVGFLYLVAKCGSFLASDKKVFLMLNSASEGLNLLMYTISGLYISCVSLLATICRNLYNSRRVPRMSVNFLLLGVSLGLAVLLSDSDEFSLLAYIPIINLIMCSLAVFYVRSYTMVLVILCFSDILWTVYDLSTLMLMGMVTDIAGFLMPAMKSYLSYIDKKIARRALRAA